MHRALVGLFLFAFTGVAAAQPPVAPVPSAETGPVQPDPYTGAHAADLMVTSDGAQQPVGFCQDGGGPTRYIDMRFLLLKQTGPAQKEPLILSTITSSTGEQTDTYRTGVVNTGHSLGVHVLFGQWTNHDTAYEFGGTYIDPFFYKRSFDAITVGGSNFSSGFRSTVTFLPTQASFDGIDVYYQTQHWGLESNLRRRVSENDCRWLDAIVGLRYHQIHERYFIDASPVDGARVIESYNTGNDIFGVQLGFEGDRKLIGYWSLRAAAKYVFGVDWQWQSFRGTPGEGLLTNDAVRGYHQDARFGNFADFSLAVVAKLTPNIETSLGATALLFGGIKRAADTFDFSNLDNPTLKSGQDWMALYGLQWTVKIDF